MSCLKSCLLAVGYVSDDPCLKGVNNYLVLCLGSIILAFLSTCIVWLKEVKQCVPNLTKCTF